MLLLIGSIILSSYLTLSFKLVERFGLNTFQVIVFNYITCVITGSIVNGAFPISTRIVTEPWFFWACLMGASFISIFNLIAFITQRTGVAVASVANKLSLVIPFLFSIYLYNEKASALKIVGILVALTAVIFTCWPSKKMASAEHHKLTPFLLFAPAVLFLSSGLLDTMIKYVEHHFLNAENQDSYLISAFAAAGSFGILILLYQFATHKQQFSWKALLMGMGIGIPNYFSIWCLMKVLQQNAGNSSAIFPINNMGIVLFSTLAAMLLFKEKLSLLNWAGIFLSLGAIAIIAFG